MSQHDSGMVDAAAAIFKEMNETAYLLYTDAMRSAETAGEVSTEVGDKGQQYNGAARLCVLVSMKMRNQEPTHEAVEQEVRDFAASNMRRYRAETGR